MKTLFKILFLTLLWVSVQPIQANPGSMPVFGRYVGVLKHDVSGKEQLAKLDFIVSRTSTSELELKAILTLHFGDFKSAEYVSFHYEKVRYNILTGTLTFDDPEQALSLFVKNFSGDKLVGDVTSPWAGRVGELTLRPNKSADPTLPLIEPIWGEYAGSCGDYKAKLQLYTYRSTGDLAHQAQPFSSYQIRGNLPINCIDGSCVTFNFESGSYNYFAKREQLTLVGTRTTIKCDVDGNNIHCTTAEASNSSIYSLTNCNFKRISKETAEPRQFTPTENLNVFNSVSKPAGEPGSLEVTNLQSGEYQGYVYHEFLGRYQAASLNINVFQAGSGPEGGARISSHAKLYFGEHGSSEVLPYRFSEKVYPNPIAGAQNVVLSRIDGNVDAVIQITEAKNGVVRGIWYSIIFGRVGPFELRKDSLPTLPEGSKKVESLSGVYRGTRTVMAGYEFSQWLIRLMVVPGIKPSTTSENPFFPNMLRGSMYLYPVTPSLAITDGSYDFYTGRFGFTEGKDNSPEHSWVGTKTSNDELQLYHIFLPGLTTIPKQRAEIFKLEKGGEK